MNNQDKKPTSIIFSVLLTFIFILALFWQQKVNMDLNEKFNKLSEQLTRQSENTTSNQMVQQDFIQNKASGNNSQQITQLQNSVQSLKKQIKTLDEKVTLLSANRKQLQDPLLAKQKHSIEFNKGREKWKEINFSDLIENSRRKAEKMEHYMVKTMKLPKTKALQVQHVLEEHFIEAAQIIANIDEFPTFEIMSKQIQLANEEKEQLITEILTTTEFKQFRSVNWKAILDQVELVQ